MKKKSESKTKIKNILREVITPSERVKLAAVTQIGTVNLI